MKLLRTLFIVSKIPSLVCNIFNNCVYVLYNYNNYNSGRCSRCVLKPTLQPQPETITGKYQLSFSSDSIYNTYIHVDINIYDIEYIQICQYTNIIYATLYVHRSYILLKFPGRYVIMNPKS